MCSVVDPNTICVSPVVKPGDHIFQDSDSLDEDS